MSDQRSHHERALDASGTVVVNLPCLHCGYDQHGMSRDDKCPECGTETIMSLASWLLRFAPAEWIDDMASGARLSALGLGLLLLSSVAMLSWTKFPNFAWLAIAAVGVIVDAVGTLRMTGPPPGVEPRSVYDGAGRPLIRHSLGIGCLALVAGLAINLALRQFHPTTILLLGAWYFSLFIVRIMHLGYLAEIVERIPDERLEMCIRLAQSLSALAMLIIPVGCCVHWGGVIGIFLLAPNLLVLGWTSAQLSRQAAIAFGLESSSGFAEPSVSDTSSPP